jgi:hypothetical protein
MALRLVRKLSSLKDLEICEFTAARLEEYKSELAGGHHRIELRTDGTYDLLGQALPNKRKRLGGNEVHELEPAPADTDTNEFDSAEFVL